MGGCGGMAAGCDCGCIHGPPGIPGPIPPDIGGGCMTQGTGPWGICIMGYGAIGICPGIICPGAI